MSEQNHTENMSFPFFSSTGESVQDALAVMAKEHGFEVIPREGHLDFDKDDRYVRLKLNAGQQTQINALLSQLPAAAAAGQMARAYQVRFPDGLNHALANFKTRPQNEYWAMAIGPDGKFLQVPSLVSMKLQAVLLGTFTAMSLITGQYFLAEINSKMEKMQMSIDRILDFLYGDKKAELLAEVNFTQGAYRNYTSIMNHDEQRAATIGSLQQAKKVALKDMEFYMGDLDAVIRGDSSAEIQKVMEKAEKTKNCLELSMQLYVTANILEVYYAQNYDTSYLQYTEQEMLSVIDKYENQLRTSLGSLRQRVESYKPKGLLKGKVDVESYEQQVKTLVEVLNSGESALRKSVRSTLRSIEKSATYYLDADGSVYFKPPHSSEETL